jgi:drug/metabolite transporter (DMT)-like permease
MMNERIKATDFQILSMVFIWGLNYPFIKFALSQFLPMSFNILRFSLSSIFLLILVKLFPDKDISFKGVDMPRLFLLALLGNTAYQLLFIYGIEKTTASVAALIAASIPIFTGIFSILWGYERIKLIGWIGILLSFCGIFFIIQGRGGGDPLLERGFVGNLMLIGATMCWALYTVIAKPMLKKYPPLILTAYAMALGTVFLWPFAVEELILQDWAVITTNGWLALSYSFSLAIGLGYVVWYRGVSHIGGVRTAVYTNLTPIFAVIFSFFILGERLKYTQLLGGLVVGLGIYLVRFRGGIEEV